MDILRRFVTRELAQEILDYAREYRDTTGIDVSLNQRDIVLGIGKCDAVVAKRGMFLFLNEHGTTRVDTYENVRIHATTIHNKTLIAACVDCKLRKFSPRPLALLSVTPISSTSS